MSDARASRCSAPAPSRTPRCRRSCSGCGSPRPTGAPVHAVALRCQIRIEPQRRRYDADEEARLVELFGETPQWGDSLRPFLWTHVGDDGRRLHRLDRDRPAGRVHLRLRGRGRPSTSTRSTTARSRCCCCSPAPCSPSAATGFVGRAGRVARGGVVPPPGAGVARHDGPLLPEQRLAARQPRHARRAARGSRPRARCPPGTDAFEQLLKEAGEDGA